MNIELRAALTSWLALSEGDRVSFADALIALGVLPRLGGAAGPVAAPTSTEPMRDDEPDHEASPSWLLTDAAGVSRVDPELFASTIYRNRVEIGGYANCYLAGCEGLAGLGRQLRRPVFKAGTCGFATAAARMAALGLERYGAAWRAPTKKVVVEDGFEFWRLVAMPHRFDRPKGSPVTFARRTVDVQLPAGLSPQSFDRRFSDALRSRSLAAFAATDSDHRDGAEIGVEPARLRRLTPDRRGGATRYSEATELILVEPRNDAAEIASVIETIVATHVMMGGCEASLRGRSER